MFAIVQGDDGWQLLRDEEPVGPPRVTYQEAVALLAEQDDAPPASTDGLLSDVWSSAEGICFAEPTGDGRDFTGVAWSWREPGVSLLPLMYQDQTEMGHFGARLAGYITDLSEAGGTVHASGRFYDSEIGRQARDVLLDGRRFGVSIDGGAADVEFACDEEDEDGWCLQERIIFSTCEILGLTMTPFPAFARAAIALGGDVADLSALAVAPADHAFTDGNDDGNCDACLEEDDDGNCTRTCDLTEAEHNAEGDEEPAPPFPPPRARVASVALARPPRAWFYVPEPDDDDDRMVSQGGGRLACPVTITEDGAVYGHMARWGQCHVGLPGCTEPPESPTNYARFHTGAVLAAEGDTIPTGVLFVGTDHADTALPSAAAARDHYANTGTAWADVRVTEGVWGPWVSGALRPGLSADLVRVLRGSSLSGDWRSDGGPFDLCAILSTNSPGFPIAREALVASGLPAGYPDALPTPRLRLENGRPAALVAAGIVRRCADCERRRAAARREPSPVEALGAIFRREMADLIAPLVRDLAAVELRTRHLRSAQAEDVRSRVASARHLPAETSR